MKVTLKNGSLSVFILLSVIYGYAHITGTQWLVYLSKTVLTPMMLVYYLVSTKKVNPLYVLALAFIYCENMFVLITDEIFFVIAMGFALLFILMNMLIVTKRIGEIKVGRFCKILIPFLLIFISVLYLIFKNGGDITWIYYVLGIIIAIYGSFSLYLYLKERSESSLYYLIGTSFFILSSIVKGLNMIDDSMMYLKVLNIIFYVVSLIFISNAILRFDAKEKSDINTKSI